MENVLGKENRLDQPYIGASGISDVSPSSEEDAFATHVSMK
jgi:hypothetical protein